MASSLKPERKYHVFLSFRGEDVRNNFLGHLYRALDQEGIYTYVDSEELKKGKEIMPALMEAIEESHIAIIVFSENYASSRWCLEELVKIMDCKKERDLMILPLFYKVEPRELRTPRGSYKDAMIKHKSKYKKDLQQVNRWEKALSDASHLSGWSLKDGDESKLIQRIVKEISTCLDRTPLYVAKHPVGIDSQVIKLKSMLNLESNDGVLMVGLWGQGGIGKTTLAKALYNAIHKQFQGSCFLADVQKTSKYCNGLVSLQKKMLSDILLRKRLVVSNVHGGTNQLREKLCRKKVLLILDDVDDLNQLNALAGEGKLFGNGSRLIITTRDKHLLTSHGIGRDHVYEVRELGYHEARELLSKHAFSTQQKLKIKKDLVDGVLNHAKGLPLALEVLGSFLCGRTEDEWKSALDDIATAPKKHINDVLKISYDGLEANAQKIFLDIACFFKGWNSEYVIKVLDSCDCKTIIGLQILIERSLIRMENGTLQMHDLIQLMGMDIVNQESDDPRGRSRLWLHDDVVDVVSSKTENCATKAIVLQPPEPTKICIGPDALTKMRRLRLLILRNVHNSFQGPICLPNELRWFQWAGCGPPIPDYSFGRKKLVGLDLSNCKITIVLNQFKNFQNLKYINFSHCESLVRMPDLSSTPNLEELDLHHCNNLVEVHESVAHLDKLRVLNLKECFELSVFPNVLKSKNLRALDFCHCTKFERFPDIPHELKGLKKLLLIGTAIKELPTSIENLVALKELTINDCKNLEHLPPSIYKLQNLERLKVEDCTNLIRFPKYEDSVDLCMKAGLSNLRLLWLSGCNLSEVEFLGNLSCLPLLKTLGLNGNNFTTLPTSINKRDSLSHLGVSNCHQLQEIPELPLLCTSLAAHNCKSLQKNEDLTSIDHIVRGALADDSFSKFLPKYSVDLPQEEMPQWVFPNGGVSRGDSVFFMVSKDFYDKILGLVFCAILHNDEQEETAVLSNDECVKKDEFLIVPHADDIELTCEARWSYLLDSDHIHVEYLLPSVFWEIVDFAQIDGRHIKFGLGVAGRIVKKWGFRIICKQLGDDLKAELRDNQLIDPALLYEVGHRSIDSTVESSYVHEGNSSEADLEEDSQDSQMSTGKHSQIGSKRKRESILSLGKRIKTMFTSIFDRWR